MLFVYEPPSGPGSARDWSLSSHLQMGMTIVTALRWQVRPAWTWGSPVKKSSSTPLRVRCGSGCAADHLVPATQTQERESPSVCAGPVECLTNVAACPLILVCLRTCQSLWVDLDGVCLATLGTAPTCWWSPRSAAPLPSLAPVRNGSGAWHLLAVLLSARLETRTKESKELACWMADI